MGRYFIRQPMVNLKTGWTSIRQPILAIDNVPKKARTWQAKAFHKLIGKKVSSVYGPPATGKGVLICMMASEYLRLNPNNKVIIAAPQKAITEDIRSMSFILPSTGQQVDWAPVYLNDTRYNTDSNLELSRSFLVSPRITGGISDGAIIMTHASLVNLFKNHTDLLKDVLVIFDEYHHILFGENEDGVVETNQLGEVARYALNTTDANINIFLATATPYRGDRYPIIPNGVLSSDCEYEHPYDEAWNDFAPLENFGVDFILYKDNSYKNAMNELMGETIEPSIIFVPNVGSRYSVGDKHDDVMECYRAIAGKKTPIIKKDDIFTYVKRGKEWIRCIDLVDDTSNRDQKVRVISEDHKNLDPTKRKIDVILALGMMKEGANWRWAKNEYIIGARGSLREFVQMIGRLFRSAEGKHITKTFYMLPHCKHTDNEEYEENFNEYLKATMASLLLIKVYAPRLISTPVEGEEEDVNRNKRQKCVNFIDIVLPDIEQQERLLEEARDIMLAASEEFDEALSIQNGRINADQRELLKQSLNEVLDSFNITEHREEVKEEILRRFAAANQAAMLDVEGMNVGDIDFEMVKDIHPLYFIIKHSSKAFWNRNV